MCVANDNFFNAIIIKIICYHRFVLNSSKLISSSIMIPELVYLNQLLVFNHVDNGLQHNGNGLCELVCIVGFAKWRDMDEQSTTRAAVESSGGNI